mmetsp:Transcript_899/g.1469  ORF Transcript_899/g.1469 Transcript_899/m.1469 type:complete len:88 (-) Transcript_899:236-499(-)
MFGTYFRMGATADPASTPEKTGPAPRNWKDAPRFSKTPRVNATKEILLGVGLGLAAGLMWRSWHMNYRHITDTYYANYHAKLAENEK